MLQTVIIILKIGSIDVCVTCIGIICFGNVSFFALRALYVDPSVFLFAIIPPAVPNILLRLEVDDQPSSDTVIVCEDLIVQVRAFYAEFLEDIPDQQEIDDMGHFINKQPGAIEGALMVIRSERARGDLLNETATRATDAQDEFEDKLEKADERIKQLEKELRRKNEKVTDIGERLDRTLARYWHLKDDYELMMVIKNDTSYHLKKKISLKDAEIDELKSQLDQALADGKEDCVDWRRHAKALEKEVDRLEEANHSCRRELACARRDRDKLREALALPPLPAIGSRHPSGDSGQGSSSGRSSGARLLEHELRGVIRAHYEDESSDGEAEEEHVMSSKEGVVVIPEQTESDDTASSSRRKSISKGAKGKKSRKNLL